MPDLLHGEEWADLCREPECEAHGSGNVPCPVKAVERAVQDRLTPEAVEEVRHRGVSSQASKAWEVYQGEGDRIHTNAACATNGSPMTSPSDGILAFLHDSAEGNELYLITRGLGMPPAAIPDEYREPVGLESLCGSCARDLKDGLPEDVNA